MIPPTHRPTPRRHLHPAGHPESAAAAKIALLVALSLAPLSLTLPAHPASAQRARSVAATRLPPRPLPPPALLVQGPTRSVPLKITAAHIEARVVGHLAQTSLTLTFHNPNPRAMEGTLYFPLPAGAVVSGYALDIHGEMVDGVVVARDKARKVFEAEVRKGIDPGIVEWTRGSSFKTRIYPIPARGTRTVRVSYVADVGERQGQALYRLPLSFRAPVAHLSIRVEVVRAATEPVIEQGAPTGMRFGKWRDSHVASVKMRDAKLSDDLVIRLPDLNKTPVRVERAPTGSHYFAIRDTLPAHLVAARSQPGAEEAAAQALQHGRIALYWDASLSRARIDHRPELATLRAYFSGLGATPVLVDLVVFRDVAAPPRRFQLPGEVDALLDTLRRVDYDGGTQLGSIGVRAKRLGKVDLNLLFTDGISNLGVEDPKGLTAPTYVINAAVTANHPMLRFLALRTGGAVFQLRQRSASSIAKQIGRPSLSFLGARVVRGRVGATWPQLAEPVAAHFALAGTLLTEEATIAIDYGRGGQVLHTRTFIVRKAEAHAGDLLRRYWAQKKINELLIFPTRNADAITAVGRRFGVVTPGTSLIVLERLDQYVQHNIRPPASLAKMQRAWRAAMDERARNEKALRTSKLNHILALWKKRVTWWKTRFKPQTPVGRKLKRRAARATAFGAGSMAMRGAGSGGGGSARASRSGGIARLGAGRSPSASPKAEDKEAASEPRGPHAAISMKAWDPKTPYLRAIRAQPAKRQYRAYLQQRDKHGGAPAFFLDCAAHFRKQQQTALALRVLSNIAELKLDDAALLRVLAHRLAQVGELSLSIGVFEAVARLRPEDPQSHRDLALVHARRAQQGKHVQRRRRDYRRALTLLARVVMQRWDRFDEIEVIALTEFNHIWHQAKRVGVHTQPLDKRLIQHLDMDIRIVMTWDADLTDMDLHVIEPSGEEAYYGHNRTRIGGLVSRDFTQGYGPEVYAVRRAMKGKYKIRTKFFGSSAAKLTGAVTLQLDVITNYGRANERRRSVTLRLTEKKEEFTVAEITF